MKTEARDIAVAAANQVPGVAGYLTTGQAIIMTLTGVLLLVQIGYYIRKWWREETDWGVKIKAWAERHGFSRPMGLDDE